MSTRPTAGFNVFIEISVVRVVPRIIAARLTATELLAVQGHDDHYRTMAQIDTIAAQVPQTRLTRLEARGHSPHRDAPIALNAAIAAFVGAMRGG